MNNWHPAFKPPSGLGNLNTGNIRAEGISSRRRLRKRVVLGLSTTAAGTATATARARVYTPSSRLRCSFAVAFFPRNGTTEQPTIAATAVWTATPAVRDPATGMYAALQNLFTSRALPDAYELDSAAERIDVVTTLAHVASTLGEWVLAAQWEPNTPITDDELRMLFADCDLQVQGDYVTLNS